MKEGSSEWEKYVPNEALLRLCLFCCGSIFIVLGGAAKKEKVLVEMRRSP